MWIKPWKYKEGIALGAGLWIVGMMLQGSISGVQWSWVSFPANVVILCLYVAFLPLAHALRHRVYLFAWLSSPTAAVSSIGWCCLATLLMGLVPQSGAAGGFPGWEAMTSCWSFVLLYAWLTTTLGLVVIRRLQHAHLRDAGFLLSHVGLFVALLAATFGNADLQRLRLTASLGKPEWRAVDEATGAVVELPLAIELGNFTIEEYAPKLLLLDNKTGEALPKGKPEHALLDSVGLMQPVGDWSVKALRVLDYAAPVATVDTTHYVDFRSEGAACAALVEARHRPTGAVRRGWVCCGSFMFPYQSLKLDDSVSLVMPEREPRCFRSEVTVYTEAGEQIEATIEVNRPLELDGWKIYQLSYDDEKGRWSTWSVFELVYDPWLPAVYVGILLMLLGALLQLFERRKPTAEASTSEAPTAETSTITVKQEEEEML